MRCLTLILALAGLGTTALVVHQLAPVAAAPVPQPITTFPLQWGDWQGVDRPVTKRLTALLETREILYRDYQLTDGRSVLACVAVAGGNRKVAHPPAICYRGQGWRILRQDRVTWRVAEREWPMEILQVQKDQRQRTVISWYRVGARSSPSYLEQQWWGLQEDLRGSEQPSALFRFSTAWDAEHPERAEQVLLQFLEHFLEPLEAAMERRTQDPDAVDPGPLETGPLETGGPEH